MTSTNPNNLSCESCKHFTKFGMTTGKFPIQIADVCPAFPNGIPEKYMFDATSHKKPINGIKFELSDGIA